MLRIGNRVAAVAVVVALGCAPGGEATELRAGPKPANTDRSAACLSWQDAYCDHLAGACATMARSQCEQEIGSLFCASDEAADRCAQALPSASCTGLPEVCEEVADPAPARWYCLTFIDLLCARGEACGLEASDTCEQSAGAQLDCDSAVGALPAVESCLGQLGSLPCASLSAGQLPEACVGVIRY